MTPILRSILAITAVMMGGAILNANPPHYIDNTNDKDASHQINENDRALYDKIESGATPTGSVMYFNLASCPSGWTELTSARGRYIVGLPESGTLAATVGTAMSNSENRAVGRHAHPVSDPGHTHPQTLTSTPRAGTASGATGGTDFPTGEPGGNTSSNTTGLTVSNSTGTFNTVGTNAPYLQLLVCEKT